MDGVEYSTEKITNSQRGSGCRSRGQSISSQSSELTIETVERKIVDYGGTKNVFEQGGATGILDQPIKVLNDVADAGGDARNGVHGELREFIKDPCRGDEKNEDSYNRSVDEREKRSHGKLQNGIVGDLRKGGKGRGRKFWIENKLLPLEPIPHVSSEVLEENDVKLVAEEILGYSDSECSSQTRLTPILPSKITHDNNGLYHIETLDQLRLHKNVQINTRLLFVDSTDVLYLRCHEPDQPDEDRHIGTIQKLQSCMYEFYSKFRNQAKTCAGQNHWIPRSGEVVVVKLQRLKRRALATDGRGHSHFEQTEYHRAIVRGIQLDGATVELIDDYGTGLVQLTDVFRILGKYTSLQPQMFICELADMEVINFRKLVHSVLRYCPISNIWPDCHSVDVRTTWLGDVSTRGMPLVEIIIETGSLQQQRRQVSLKTHVYTNLQSVLNPLIHLTTRQITQCTVHDADDKGFLWITFAEDQKLRNRMRFVLDNLVPYYHNLRRFLHLTMDMIFPRDKPHLRKRNQEKVYATLLSGVEDGSLKLYRVTIQGAYSITDKIKVYCIDHHSFHDVNSWELVPMYNLYPDLSYISPLVLRVHLYQVKELMKDDQVVKGLLYGEEVQVKLVHEYPDNIYPPEVALSRSFEQLELAEFEETHANIEALKSGFAHILFASSCAKKLDPEDKQPLSKTSSDHATALEKDKEHKDKLVALENAEEKELEDWWAGQVFMGENYKFEWRRQRTIASSAASCYSVTSTSTGVSK